MGAHERYPPAQGQGCGPWFSKKAHWQHRRVVVGIYESPLLTASFSGNWGTRPSAENVKGEGDGKCEERGKGAERILSQSRRVNGVGIKQEGPQVSLRASSRLEVMSVK